MGLEVDVWESQIIVVVVVVIIIIIIIEIPEIQPN